MLQNCFIATTIVVGSPCLPGGLTAATPDRTTEQRQAAVRQIPLIFTPNVGQARDSVRFTARGPGYSLSLTTRDATLVMASALDGSGKPGSALRMRVAGANPDPRLLGADEFPGKTNYIVGNDPEKWRRGVPSYGKVVYEAILPGIDLMYYGRGRELEYDFRIAPGADPRRIEVVLDGDAWAARATASGDLEIGSAAGSVQFRRPVAYQLARDGSQQRVAARYLVRDKKRFGFRLGRYDHSRELVIDPPLVWATYYGGSQQDYANGVAVDQQGNVYIAGATSSTDLPTTPGALYQTNPAAAGSSWAPNLGQDVTGFVAKFNSTLSQLIYATYLGGSTAGYFSGPEGGGAAVDQVNAIAIDNAGNVYLTGGTTSTDFPLKNPVQSTCGPANNIDRFYCTVTATSTCSYSGGGLPDAFVTKLDPTGANLIYSTYLGGSMNDVGSAIAVNPATGEAFVAGGTLSTDSYGACAICPSNPKGGFGFPTTASAFLATPVSDCSGSTAYASVYAFLARLSATGALEYSTYFGPNAPNTSYGKNTGAGAVALDPSDPTGNNVFVAGASNDSALPTTANVVQPVCPGCPQNSGWVAKFNTGASGAAGLLYLTYIGGPGDQTWVSGVAADKQGNAYITGATDTTVVTTAGSLQPARPSGYSPMAYASKLNPLATQFVYSTYLGSANGPSYGNAIAVDPTGAAVVTGETGNPFSFSLVNPVQTWAFGSAYLLTLTPDGSATSFSTYFGGYSFGGESSLALALDNSGNGYIAGYSNNLAGLGHTGSGATGSYSPCPNLNNCGTINNGNLDAFVAKLSGIAAGSQTNTPPTANAGANQTVQCAGPTTSITLNGSGADSDGDSLTYVWKDQNGKIVGASATAIVGCSLGTFTYYLTVTDSAGLSDTSSTQVTVQDTTPPTLTLSKTVLTVVVPMATATGATVSLAGVASATDTCDPNPIVTNNAPALFPIGTTVVTFTASDHSGNRSAPQQLTVQVVYNFGGFLPPVATGVTLTAGQAILVQFQLTAADGTIVTNATATLQVLAGGVAMPVSSVGNANSGNLLRFSPTSNSYVYNLSTRSYAAGTYVFKVALNDGTVHSVQIALK